MNPTNYQSKPAKRRSILAIITTTVYRDDIVVTEVSKEASRHDDAESATANLGKRIKAAVARR